MSFSPHRILPVLLLACASGLAAESRRSAIPAPVPAPVLADAREGAPRMAPVRWGQPEGAAAEVRPVAAPAEETLLDEVGRLRRQVQPAEPWLWKDELARPGTLARQAWLHLRLGEWKLAGSEQPEAARWHFRQARRLAPAGDPARGLAHLNDGIALFYLRGYREAADAFAALQEAEQAPKGLDPRRVTLWHRLADRTAAYHEANGRLGIPQSSRLNPECGASALFVALEALGLPHDRKAVLRHTRVTGMGSTVPDLVAAAGKLGAEGRAVRADEQGFRALPKPLVAHVESDHFVAVVRADAKGVAYRCGHCGAWPGGERTLTWKQWRAMRPGLFVTVTRTRSAASRALTAALRANDGTERKGLRLAATGLRGLGPEVSSLSLLLRGHVFQWTPAPIYPGCGMRPAAAKPAPWMQVPESAPYGNTFAGDPVNLATGEEQYQAPADLTVYNPRGPAVVWQRLYNSLRSRDGASYECDSYGIGWSHTYNTLVQDPDLYQIPQIAQGTLWWVRPTTHEAPGAGLSWDILLNGQVVATSAAPNGWNVSFQDPDLAVTVPPGAALSSAYKVRSVSNSSFRPCGVFGVRAYNAVPQASGARAPITGAVMPSVAGWDVVKDGVVIATAADPQGWTVRCFPNDNELEVLAPLNAPVGGSYEGRIYIAYPYYRAYSAPFSVVAGSMVPGPGTKYLVFPNGSRTAFTAPAVPSAGLPQVACTTDPNAPLRITWEYDPDNQCGFFNVLHADGSRWHLQNDTWDFGNGQVHPLKRVVNRTGQALLLTYAASRQWYSRVPLLARISDAATGSTLLTINRAAQNRGMILNVTDCYGRAVYYAHNNTAAQVDYVSQIVTPGTLNAPARWGYGYTFLGATEAVSGHYLTSLTTPSPTGTGWSTAHLEYHPTTFFIKRTVDANGNSLEYLDTDASHTRVTAKDPQGNAVHSYTVGFDSLMNETTRTDGTNVTVVSTLEHNDPSNPYRPSAVIDGNNRRTELTWDQYGHPLTVTSPRGVQTVYTWDYTVFPLGRLTQVQVGAKTPTSFTYYEPSGLPHSVTGPRPGGGGGTVMATFTYDALGNLLTSTAPGNNATTSVTTTLSYTADGAYTQPAAVGQVLAAYDHLGRAAHFRYGARGNLASAWDAYGNQRDLTYNLADQPVTVTQPPTGKTGPGRSSATYGYLFPGGLSTGVSVRDENGTLVRQAGAVYGAEGEVLATTGNVEATSHAYDALYRPVGFSDGKSQTTTYAYHPSGYLASVSYPGGGSVQLPLYDAAGNLLRSIDGRGQQTDYVYNDPAGALTDVQYTGHPGLSVHLAYDTYGRLQTLTDGQGTESYTYDDGDRGVTKTRAYTGGPTLGLTYGYYPDGSRQSVTTPAGNFSYQYDAAGRLAGMTNPFSEGFAWTYLDNGWLKTQSSPAATTTWTYNSRGMLEGLAHAGSSLLAEWTGFGYNGADNRTSITANVPGASALTGQTTWGYDSLDRLTGESSTRGSGYSHGFGYDAAGNPTTFKGSGRTFNANNQESGTTYDGNGNPAAHGGAVLTFDPLDRLTAYGGVLTAGYTSAGLRAWKQSAAGRTYFLYDGATPVVETNALGAVTASNSFGPAGLLSRRTAAGSVFYTFDPQGSVAQRLDASGNVLTQHAFDAYGSELTTPAASDPFGYKAQFGYYTDRETGLQLLTHRYYDPAAGRFLTRDPIGYAGGANLYAYCLGNPVNFADPLGFCPQNKPNRGRNGLGGLAHGMALGIGDLPEDINADSPEYAVGYWAGAASTGAVSAYSVAFAAAAAGGRALIAGGSAIAATTAQAPGRILNVGSGPRPIPGAVNLSESGIERLQSPASWYPRETEARYARLSTHSNPASGA